MPKRKSDKYLNNNENLPIHVDINYTAEQIEEFRKCKEDVIYFAENFFYIVNLDEGKQKIKLYEPQKDAILKIVNNRRTVICASRQVGKALALDTPVPTPNGWTTMGSLKDDDQVFDENGQICNIIKAHDIRYDRECYEITFSNGEKIVADESHEWFTQSKRERRHKLKGTNKTTKELLNTLHAGLEPNHRIRMAWEGPDNYIYIKDIRLVDSVPVRCISVDSPSHLFLCGKTRIPTHNSTLMTVVCLWYALFTKNHTVAILANKEDQAKEILERIKLAYEEIPNYIKAGVWDFTKEQVKLTNGSKIFVSTTSADAIRGKSVNLLFIDEFAHVRKEIADDFFKSIIPTLSSSKKSKLVIVSCVTKDTCVYTDRGIKQIKDFIPNEKEGLHDIPPYKVAGKTPDYNNGQLFFNNGKAEIIELSTQSSSLRCSKTHKLFACKNGEYRWAKVGELTPDDYIAIKYGMNLWGNYSDISQFKPTIKKKLKNIYSFNSITPDLAYLFGLYISEGSVYRKKNKNNETIGGTITLTCGDDLSGILDKLNLKYSTDKSNMHYYISSKYMIELLEFIGFDLTRIAKHKIIPDNLLCMSRENTSALLQGIFDGDGSANNGNISFTSSNKQLTKQIRIILINYGILSMYGEHLTQPTKRAKISSMGYRIELNNFYSKLFYEQIGFRFNRKQNKYINVINADTCNTKDIIPNIKELIREDFDNIRKDEVPDGLRSAMYTDKDISRFSLLKFRDIIGEYTNIIAKEIIAEDIKWEKIKTIEEQGSEEVYDFSLDNLDIDDQFDWHHSVLYNGIIGHQTPKGTENKFYDIFSNAEKKKSNWEHVKIFWHQIPGRDETWKKEQLEAISYDMSMWNQEFDLHFLEDGTAALNLEVIERLKNMCIPAEFTYDFGDYMVWHAPEPHKIYSIGVDVAEGGGQDYSVAQILDITDPTDIIHCATFATNKLQPYIFAEKLNQIARSWGRPFLCIERNKEGGQVVDAMSQVHQYDNIIHYTMKSDKRGVYQNLGIFCHQNSKYTGIMNMKYFIEHLEAVKIFDIATIKEFETFIRKENKTWGAKKGHHDDRIMALIWALILLEKDIAEKYLEVQEYDETGKPCRILDPNQEISNISFYNKNEGFAPYAKTANMPPPVFFIRGNGVSNYRETDMESYTTNGWTFL